MEEPDVRSSRSAVVVRTLRLRARMRSDDAEEQEQIFSSEYETFTSLLTRRLTESSTAGFSVPAEEPYWDYLKGWKDEVPFDEFTSSNIQSVLHAFDDRPFQM